MWWGVMCKRKVGLTCLILLLFFEVSAQNKLADAISFSTRVTGDFIYNYSGGIKKGYTYIGMEDFSVGLNTGTAGWWKGGNFFVHGLNGHGKGISEFYTGDFQVLSNIEAGDYTGLYEYYFSQEFGNFFLLAGQHDLNSEFIGTKYGGTFVNSSFGIAPSISLNVPVSIYPVAAPCLLVKYATPKGMTYKIAAYDGDPGDFESNRFNVQWNLNSDEGFFTIAEVEYNHVLGERSTSIYKAGTYYHTGKFINYDDTTRLNNGNYGFYAIVDQPLFANSLGPGRGLCFFIQAGIAPQKFNMVSGYLGAGFRYHGILPNRFYDELGIAFAHIAAGRDYYNSFHPANKNETAIEATYRFVFGRRYTIQPSFQYIIDPGMGTYANSFVSLLRFVLEY